MITFVLLVVAFVAGSYTEAKTFYLDRYVN